MRCRAKSRCSPLMVRPTTWAPWCLAAYSAKPPQPHPAGPEVDGFGQAPVFVVLRGGEVGRIVLEQRRGIGHARVKPGRIEGIADIVVRVDIAARLSPRVAVEPVANHLDETHHGIVAKHRDRK